jgi:Protein of unknown function (DUF3455)
MNSNQPIIEIRQTFVAGYQNVMGHTVANSFSTPNSKITFIQRICTVGGLAPTTVPNEANLGEIDSIPYAASYLFYEKN